MKLKPPAAAAATARSPVNRFLGICLAAFLTIISTSSAVAKTGAAGLNPTEKWVVTQATAGDIADLSKIFPEEKDRKLSAHFLEDLLTGTLPGVKLHRHGVQIIGATIDESIDLENAQIPCDICLADCQFNKSAIFMNARFAGLVLFDHSVFKADTDFTGVKVGGAAFFRKAVFEGPVEFGWADITANYQANGAKFQNKEHGVSFDSMKVGGAAVFKDAVFEGSVDFRSADIASDFVADGAKFQNKEEEASFDGMKVRGAAFFKDAVFEGPVEFNSAYIASQFGADWTKFQNKEEGASFDSMKVGQSTFFNDSVFEGPVNFGYADFAALDLSGASWPKVAARFNMQGMSYKYIRAVRNNERESHKALLTLAKHAAYTADVYSNLEEFFLRQGYRADADEAFIAGKRREREEYFRSALSSSFGASAGYWFRWLGSWMLYLLVGYGRRPWQAGIPCAVLVALGCVLFSPKKMEPQRLEDAPRVYSRFWYSLGLFLPFVDLQADKVWKPKADQTFLRNYMRVHILLGWILVPLVLAALTGLIK